MSYDLSFLLEQVDGDTGTVRELVGLFCETLQGTTREMEVAEATGDLRRLASLGHRLKSPALAIGATELAEACLILQNGGSDAAIRREAIARIRSARDNLPPALTTALSQLHGEGDRGP